MGKDFQPAEKAKSFLLIFLIIVVVFLVFMPELHNRFVWDDYHNLIENTNYRGLSPSHLKWMFTTFYDENYHPLCWISLGLDFIFWKMNPTGYHLTNIILHAANSILFFFFIVLFLHRTVDSDADLNKSAVQISGASGALFFAIHPLRVETVSYISTRGDILCGFFYLLTIISYIKMNDNKEILKKRKWFYCSLIFFVCSLLSRAWGITLPLVLLIMDVYPLRRINLFKRSLTKKILLEKIPYVFFAFGAGILAILAKKPSMLNIYQHNIINRLIQASYGLCFYVFKTVVPVRFSPLYLLEKNFNPFKLKYILCLLLISGITLLLIHLKKRWPWAITAWVCYLVIVSPLLGMVQSGPQIVADRYTYISCMPFGILVGAGIFKLISIWRKKKIGSSIFYLLTTGILLILFIESLVTFHLIKIYHDDGILWTQAIIYDPANYVAYNNRGVFFREQGEFAKAFADYDKAIKLYPNNPGAFYNRGLLNEELKNYAGAVSDYTRVIQLDPGSDKAFNNRGGLLKNKGDLSGAIADFNNAIRLNPYSPEAYANRGVIKEIQKDFNGATRDFTKALEVAPDNWHFKSNVERILSDIMARNKKGKGLN